MDAHDKRIIHSSAESNWRTPPALYNRLFAEFEFGLDAAADDHSHLCERWMGPSYKEVRHVQDALGRTDWHEQAEYWPIFINPPYSKKQLHATGNPAMDIAEWAKWCAINAQHGATIVGLFPYSVQTKWWYQYVRHGEVKAREIRTIPHRVSYLHPGGLPADNAGGNSCVIIWQPPCGYVGDWQPAERVWDYR